MIAGIRRRRKGVSFQAPLTAFNSEAFLSACGVLDDVKAMTPKPPRQRGELIDYTYVQPGDCLIYDIADGRSVPPSSRRAPIKR
jgi:hypothetical protein